MTEDWKEWARREKTEVYEIAQKYSGSFVNAMVEAFLLADNRNTEKLLNTFSEYFEKLYQFHLKLTNE